MANQHITYDNLINHLLQEVLELRPILDQHRSDQLGELLPYILFG